MKCVLPAVAAIGHVIVVGACAKAEVEFKTRPVTQQYESVEAIADDLAAAGIACGGLTRDASTTYSTDAGRCFIDGREIVLSTFASDSRQEENIARLAGPFESIGLEYGFPVGSKWMINCGDTNTKNICTDMKAQLGGRIVKPN